MTFAKNMQIAESDVSVSLTEIARSVDGFENYSCPHALKIANLADSVASELGFADHDRSSLKQAAMFHDIGERLMGRDYISAARALETRERLDLQRHPVIGEQEVAKREYPKAVQLLVRWHHEWWNGSGYPDCLKGTQIPLAARILRACDTYTAMTSVRPYRGAFSAGEADLYLCEAAGIEFDPRIVKVLMAVRDRLDTDEATDEKNCEEDAGSAE